MHRTQILLEEPHYHYLVAEARRRGVSMSQLLRRMVAREMGERNEPEDPLEALIGMATGDGTHAEEDDDRVIYGLDKR